MGNMTVEAAVITAFITAREAMVGPTPLLEYVGGERRDTLRGESK